jgi:hypothetical protein
VLSKKSERDQYFRSLSAMGTEHKCHERCPCPGCAVMSSASASCPIEWTFDAKLHPTVIRKKRLFVAEPAMIDSEIREASWKLERVSGRQRPCPAVSFAASRTAARHSRLTGKIGGMGCKLWLGRGRRLNLPPPSIRPRHFLQTRTGPARRSFSVTIVDVFTMATI